MKLKDLKGAEGSRLKKVYRKGRGHASGNGKTAGYGHKGQKARSGAPRPGFEGGQMPLYRRIPKRGFKKPNRLVCISLNVSDFEKFDNGTVVTVEMMVQNGMLKGSFDRVKILGNGNLTKNLTIEACNFSESAKQKIEAAGGTCKTCEGCKEVNNQEK